MRRRGLPGLLFASVPAMPLWARLCGSGLALLWRRRRRERAYGHRADPFDQRSDDHEVSISVRLLCVRATAAILAGCKRADAAPVEAVRCRDVGAVVVGRDVRKALALSH